MRRASTTGVAATFAVLTLVAGAWAQLPDSCPTVIELNSLSRAGITLRKTSIDTGWSGFAHFRDNPDGYNAALAVSCPSGTPPCGICSIAGMQAPTGRCSNDRTVECDTINAPDADDCGGARCDFFFFPTTPENVGSTPACVDNRLTADVSGTVNPGTGAMELLVPVVMDIYIGITQDQPCPICVGDVTPRDGVRDGLCAGGDRDGLACDVSASDPTFGETSLDCPGALASTISGAGLGRDLALTTGTRSLAAGLACEFPFVGFDCPCGVCSGDETIPCRSDADCAAVAAGTCGDATIGGATRQPNSCVDFICNDTGDGLTGRCSAPVDRYCDGFLRASGEPILTCGTNDDCIAVDPVCPGGDCGDCTIDRPRPCFLDPIVAAGVANTTQPVLADALCMSYTASGAANAAVGWPGPERVRLEVELIGACQPADNCPSIDNPDQLNSDCPDPSVFACGGCSGTVPAALAGCCDGGDVCDPCPAYADNTRCASVDSSSAVIGSSGGQVQTQEVAGTISATVVIPPSALNTDTSVSVTENGPGTRFGLKKEGGTADVLSVGLRPEGQSFLRPVQVTLRWDDRDMDGIVDRGVCESGADLDLPCDDDADCAGGATCSVRSSIPESRLIVKRNNNRFGRNGIGNPPYTCGEHLGFTCSLDGAVTCYTNADCAAASAGTCTATLSPCSTANADCSLAAGSARRTVAKCCDPTAGPTDSRTFGEWELETCDFSEFLVGLNASALVPGRGSPKTDCFLELAPNNPINEDYLDKKGLPNFKQECRDGDPVCDRDRERNGACLFEIGLCVNVDDPRLIKKGEVQCTPTDVATWRVMSPKVDDSDPVKQANAAELLAKALELGAGVEGVGTVSYAPAVATEECSSHARVVVPLGGANADKKGKLTIKVRAETSPPPGKSKGVKDTDTLKLTCLPPQ